MEIEAATRHSSGLHVQRRRISAYGAAMLLLSGETDEGRERGKRHNTVMISLL